MSASAMAAGSGSTMPRRSSSKLVFIWIGLAVLAFPLAGYAGWGVGGHVDGVAPALIGGAITGAGIGLVQWLFLRNDLDMSPIWIPATAVALSIGLGVGAAVAGYETTASQLAVMGAITGVPVGLAQGFLLRERFSLWHVWMVAMPVMFAIGWVVTESIGVDVANQFTVFGASGSIVFGFLTGLIMMAGRRTGDGAVM